MAYSTARLIDIGGELVQARADVGGLRLRSLAGRISPAREAAVRNAAARANAAIDRLQQELDSAGDNATNPGIVTFYREQLSAARAEVPQALGELDEALGRAGEASAQYALAASAWRQLGDSTQALRSAEAARRTALAQDRDLDAGIARLLLALDGLHGNRATEALERATVEQELAAMYFRGGDSLECLLFLDRAEADIPLLPAGHTSLKSLAQAVVESRRAAGTADPERMQAFQTAHGSLLLRCVTAHQALMLHPDREHLDAYRRATATARQEFRGLPWLRMLGPLGLGAIPVARQALASLASFQRTAEAAARLNDLDGRLAQMGADLDRVLQESLEARDFARSAGSDDLTAIAERVAADVLLKLARPEQALEACRRGEALLGPHRRPDVRASLLLRAAHCLLALGDREAASRTAQRGIKIVEDFRYRASGMYIRDAQLRSWIGLYRLAADCALAVGEDARFLQVALSSKARRLSWGTEGFDPGVATRLAELGDRIDAAAEADPDELTDARSQRRLEWDRLLARHRVPPPEVPGARDLQRQLAPGEAALLHYWLDDNRLAVGLLTGDGLEVEVRRLDAGGRQQLGLDIRNLLNGEHRAEAKARSVLRRLGERTALLLPSRPERLLTLHRLFISTHGILHGFPLHALPLGEGTLGDAVAVSYLPNLAQLGDSAVPPQPRTLLAHIPRFRAADRRAPLDTLGEPLRQVAELHAAADRTVVTLPADVDRRRLNELLTAPEAARFGLIQIATHGQSVLDVGDSPMESRLWLHSSEVDGLDIASWRLDGSIVVLTACSSGQRALTGRHEVQGEAPVAGDEVLGLQAGFFAAGATAVLGCLWRVDAEVAGIVTVALHRHLLAGLPPDRALQKAVADYRAGASGVIASNPYKWAPFFLSTRCRPVPLPAAEPRAQEGAR
ncbi:hypothetical protein GCM10009665_49760 [Kitasatospora nipponensis]|uniref:CHAT domain-containing protein n=1 Tax=Kitasatospora nipponensis TaxID=258049 RepID=A0ABN1WKQ0_9ACTN